MMTRAVRLAAILAVPAMAAACSALLGGPDLPAVDDDGGLGDGTVADSMVTTDGGKADHVLTTNEAGDASDTGSADASDGTAPTCPPTTTQCSEAGAGVQTCQSNGEWGPTTPCSAQTCVSGSCQGVCAPGQTQCATATPMGDAGTGDTGTGDTGTGDAAPTDGGAADGAASSNAVQACAPDGTWSVPTACTNSTCIAGACQGACAPGQTQCASSGNALQSCQPDGTWGVGAACTSSTCLPAYPSPGPASCQGQCAPGEVECSTGGTTVQGCQTNGTWGAGTTCTASTTCLPLGDGGAACGGQCGPGQAACSGNNVVTCQSNGTFGNPTACSGQTCVSTTTGQASCQGVCTNATTGSCGAKLGAKGSCANGTTTCSNQQWGACSIQPAAQDSCSTPGDDSNCNGAPNDGCACVVGSANGSKACGNCNSGTETCSGGPAPSGYGGCTGASGCNPNTDTKTCTYPYTQGCPTTGVTCNSSCAFPACTPTPTLFAPSPGLPGVNGTALTQTYSTGSNCFGSNTPYPSYQYCPNGSVISSFQCNMINQGACAINGHCTFTTSGASAQVTIYSNNNCSCGAEAKLAVECTPVNCNAAGP